MKNDRERQIVYFDLTINTDPPGRIYDPQEVAKYLVERVEADLCVRRIEADRYMLSIARARIEQDADGHSVLAMLFIFADPDAADAANMHLETRAVRLFEKLDGEGRAFSAHAVMDLRPRVGNTFRVLLENAERLGKTRVQQMLHREIKQVFKDKEITVADADGEDVPAKAAVSLSTVASERLRAGVQAGTLSEVRLIDAIVDDQGFDAPAGVEVRRREMSLKVDVPVGQQIVDFLAELRPWGLRQGFDKMYVEWKTPVADEGDEMLALRTRTERAKIDLAQADVGETLFARKEFVTLEQRLNELSVEISDELLGKMIALLH